MGGFEVILLTFPALISSSCTQTTPSFGKQSADEIQEELKNLLGQEAKIYEAKLRLLQQLQNLQQEAMNILTTAPPPSLPPPITVTRIVTPSDDFSSSPPPPTTNSASIPTSTATATMTSRLAIAPRIISDPIHSDTTQTASNTSVTDLVSFSEVRVDSPTILVLNKGRKNVLVRT